MGITGGIACGKSVVLAELSRLGAVTWSADEVAREVMGPGGKAYAAVVTAFGLEIALPTGRIDRAALGDRIFSDERDRRRLEAIVHPIVLQRLSMWIEDFRWHPPNNPPVAAAEVPLLFEVGVEKLFDLTVAVVAEPQLQISRLKQRTSWPDSRIRGVIAAQMSLTEKAARAERVIRTNGAITETLAQTQTLWMDVTRSIEEESPCP